MKCLLPESDPMHLKAPSAPTAADREGEKMSEFDNGLLESEAERLAILAEECGEVIQVIGKILRHGYSSHNPNDTQRVSNRGLLAKELGDLDWIISLMQDEADFPEGVRLQRKHLKAESAKPYLHHQDAK